MVSKLEKLAMNGDEMPRGLSLPEQQLFQSLRLLYVQHKRGYIDRERGKREKAEIMKAYSLACSREKQYDFQIDIAHRASMTMMEANKHGCEICKRLTRIILGVEKEGK